jgi:uncharacterized protein YehS (DUF1456 family)
MGCVVVTKTIFVAFFPQQEGETALSTFVTNEACCRTVQGLIMTRSYWQHSRMAKLSKPLFASWRRSIVLAQLRLPFQIRQSDMVKAFQEIEKYCYV